VIKTATATAQYRFMFLLLLWVHWNKHIASSL